MKTIKTRKTMETLEPDDCRWPVGDPRRDDFHFCGATKAVGRPYCEHHWNMSLQSRSQPGEAVRNAAPARQAA